jgi:hypothetical protein
LKFTTGCKVSKFPSHSTRKKVEIKLGKKLLTRDLVERLEKVATSEIDGEG